MKLLMGTRIAAASAIHYGPQTKPERVKSETSRDKISAGSALCEVSILRDKPADYLLTEAKPKTQVRELAPFLPKTSIYQIICGEMTWAMFVRSRPKTSRLCGVR